MAIFYLKVLLDKKYFQKFSAELKKIFDQYQNEFNTVAFSDILNIMGIHLLDLPKLM
ncbi:hypothetical protein LV469_00865 [Peptoniphilus sp. GNH]|nr:hypothetical protein LV469_00865 [Peptoniphilus sp. GNH]